MPGCCLASAISSGTVRAGKSARTARTCGALAIRPTSEKSRKKSYGSFLEMIWLMTMVLVVPNTMV
ncbi:Uncharacterised protein [Bordetella pertussis]|nr:Uncharacterised protein [Bordetella pertussis]